MQLHVFINFKQGEDGQTSQAAAQPSQTTPRKTTQITIQPAENGAPKQVIFNNILVISIY